MAHSLPHRLYSVAQIREIERLAIEEYQIVASDLMERAGEAAHRIMLRRFSQLKKIIIFCGKGNNGGDGYVLARLAHHHGIKVCLYSLCQIDELPPVAQAAAKHCQKAGVHIHYEFDKIDQDADLLIDALLGIGIRGTVRDPVLSVIEKINRAHIPVLAIDIPSGLDADNGGGQAVDADITVTFIGLKQGMLTAAAPAYCGQIYCDDLALHTLIDKVEYSGERLDWQQLRRRFSPRPRDAHKGNFGHVLVVGGDYGMSGAVCMAAQAAMRVGAGLATVATHLEHVAVVSGYHPELMCYPVEDKKTLQPLLDKATVVILGPGLGHSVWSQMLFKAVLARDLPIVMDASALNLLSEQIKKRDNWILTPHPGEAGRLLTISSQEIQADRFACALELQQKTGGVVVLKGAGTIIQAENQHPYLCDGGNPGMASGGMGDVLSGIIAGLLAQGYSLLSAAQTGVSLHARAGDIAAKQGERGLLATDLICALRKLVNL
ncbi:MAG: NAD(P)H-hydrate dehydratase [Gammaproteobacteria bacterium]